VVRRGADIPGAATWRDEGDGDGGMCCSGDTGKLLHKPRAPNASEALMTEALDGVRGS